MGSVPAGIIGALIAVIAVGACGVHRTGRRNERELAALKGRFERLLIRVDFRDEWLGDAYQLGHTVGFQDAGRRARLRVVPRAG